MNNAVAGLDIGLHQRDAVHAHLVAHGGKDQQVALRCFCDPCRCQFLGGETTKHHMIEQYILQRCRVGQQGVECTRRQLGKGIIGRRKDREWAGGGQVIGKTGDFGGFEQR